MSENPKELEEATRIVKAILAQRDNAWAEDKMIREAIKANPEESTFDEVANLKRRFDLLATAILTQIEFWQRLPCGIDEDAREENTSPEDISSHIAGIAVRNARSSLAMALKI